MAFNINIQEMMKAYILDSRALFLFTEQTVILDFTGSRVEIATLKEPVTKIEGRETFERHSHIFKKARTN